MNSNIKQRSIPLCIVLTIITCGIYGIYWFVVLTDDVNYANQEQNATSGILCFLLTIVTCGIYGIYWAYKLGEKIASIKSKNAQANGMSGYYDSSSAILYLILQIFGLSIVVYALAQSELNKLS